ncbi:MAG: hypothetical protein WC004_00615 [Candidatus Absconditabacterales bacterium]
MPIIQGVNFEQRELEFLATQNHTDVDAVQVYLSRQPAPSVANFKRTIQQLLANQSPEQVTQGHAVDDNQDYNPPVETYANPSPSRVRELIQGSQDALFTALAKAKLTMNNLGDRRLGGKNRTPVHTQPFSFNPFKESFINPARNIAVLSTGYVWLQGVVNSSSSGIASVLEDTNAFSAWASLSAIQVAAMLLFLELISDIGAIAQKVKQQQRALAGQKAIWDMVQNTLYFFAIYEFNKPRQILMITLGNIFVIEKFLEEKFFEDSFATHARKWRVRVEFPLLVLMSLALSTNKTLSDMSLANASRFTAKDLMEVPTSKVEQHDFDLDPEQITAIHEHPMKLATGEYLYIVETAEKQTWLNDTGEKTFRVVTKYPISSPDDFALMSLRYYKLQDYTAPANASKILETVGDIDAYNSTLIVKADWNLGTKNRR